MQRPKVALPKSNFLIFSSRDFWTFFEMLDHWWGMVRSMLVVELLPPSNYSFPVGAVEPCGGCVAPLQPLQILQSPPPTPRLNRSTPGSGNFDGEFVRRRQLLLLLLAGAVGRGNARLCSVC